MNGAAGKSQQQQQILNVLRAYGRTTSVTSAHIGVSVDSLRSATSVAYVTQSIRPQVREVVQHER
jgi:hypothetical protein